MSIRGNLEQVRARITKAAQRAGRDPEQVRLIAVTKGVAADRIREALAAGVTEIGENRVQEARAKRADLHPSGGSAAAGVVSPLRWHLVGHLQRNKAGMAVELFDLIHSVDSLELIQTLERQVAARQTAQYLPAVQALAHRRTGALNILLQVNLSGAATPFGCAPEQVERLAQAVVESSHLKLAGLMTLAPFSANPEDSRPHFRKLRELRDQLGKRFFPSPLAHRPLPFALSMGMSQDFEVAVEEGATMVRIGTAIFGERSSR